jgi:hypothetical protein
MLSFRRAILVVLDGRVPGTAVEISQQNARAAEDLTENGQRDPGRVSGGRDSSAGAIEAQLESNWGNIAGSCRYSLDI